MSPCRAIFFAVLQRAIGTIFVKRMVPQPYTDTILISHHKETIASLFFPSHCKVSKFGPTHHDTPKFYTVILFNISSGFQ